MSTKTSRTKAAKALAAGLKQNPEIQLVLDIARRAREVQLAEPPRELGMATDVIVNPTSSQCPV